jgi:hypothetical protein
VVYVTLAAEPQQMEAPAYHGDGMLAGQPSLFDSGVR